jgi:ketosteroid isomerase-like protein
MYIKKIQKDFLMKHIKRSVLSSNLVKLAKVSAFGLFSLHAGLTLAAVSPELQKLDSQWQEVFSAKDLTAVKSYYDESSLVASFPYDADKGLKGAEAIGNMFQNGPFNLEGFNVSVTPLAFDENESTALLIKNWNVKHNGGAFSGLAVEVLEKKANGWKRVIDMAAGGFSNINDFAKPLSTKTSSSTTFEKIDSNNAQVSQLSIEKQDLALNKKIAAALQSGNYETIEAISHADKSLLIARITIDKKLYITFNAMSKNNNHWKTDLLFFNAI